MLLEQKNKNQLKPNKRRIKLLFTPFILFRSILWITFIFILVSCNTTEPPPPKPEKPKLIELKEITKSCTETFIKVTVKDTILPTTVKINRDGKEIMNYYQTKTDTTIIDTGLAAAKTYLYKATIGNKEEEKSKELQVSTLPTTSNNFTWKTYIFGDFKYGSSELLDVAIIDENDIWAVGEIYTDTTGQPYNAVHWDGQKWKLKRISVMYRDNLITTPLEGIFTFSKNDIWVTNGFPIHGNGNIWEMYHLQDMGLSVSISKVWGQNSNDIYFVGRSGSIAHYNGTSWSKIESGTTTNINDVWGIKDTTSGTSLILSTVSSRYQRGDYKFLSISGNTAEKYFSWPYTRLYGVWFNSPQKIYIVGDGGYLYENNKLNRIDLPTNSFLTRVKGTELNNIFVAGCCNTLLHFNGVSWKAMQGIYGNYEGLDIKGNLVVAVGWTTNKALILLGTRQ